MGEGEGDMAARASRVHDGDPCPIAASDALPPGEHGECPACHADLNGGGVWQHFMDEHQDEAEADRIALMYGASRTKGRWGRAIAIYSRDRDRTVAYRCPDCDHEWGRQALGESQ